MNLRPIPVSSLLVGLALLGGCAEKSFEEKVIEARSKYVVDMNGCVLQKAPVNPLADPPAGVFSGSSDADPAATPSDDPGETMPVDGDPADGEPTDGEMTDATMGDALALPQEVMCDVVMRYRDRNPLAGVTIDLTHQDPFGEVRNTFREFVDTAGLLKGDARQVSLLLEVPGYEVGDAFTLEIRSPVPAAERGEYREFTPPSGG